MLDKATLKQLNRQGLIVGDQESESDFIQRVDLLLNPKGSLADVYMEFKPRCYREVFVESLLLDEWDIRPEWIPICIGQTSLMPWEAASTWSIEFNERVSIPLLHFRKSITQKKTYFGIAFRELFTHEAVHAVRGSIQGNRFEELLAYQTSKNVLRKWLGPIFRNRNEVILYCILWSIVWMSSCLLLFVSYTFILALVLTSFVAACGMTFFGMMRLIFIHRVFAKAKKKIQSLFHQNPLTLLIRFNDSEVLEFAKLSKEALIIKMRQRSKTSLKWKQILASYEVKF